MADDAPSDIDWSRPWFEPLAPWGPATLAHWQSGASVAEALNAIVGPQVPVRFVPQRELPPDQAYEAFIYERGCVPTRDNLHDFFNGLIWQAFAQSKQQLNRLQYAQIARDGMGARRGPVRDACTVFDENAALLLAPDALWDDLRARRWSDLFDRHRPRWQQAALLLFGHAALEKLTRPYKAITVHVWRVGASPAMAADRSALDTHLAAQLSADALAAKPFAPLPVLGVPGWWADNEARAFYADAQVFRSARWPGAG